MKIVNPIQQPSEEQVKQENLSKEITMKTLARSEAWYWIKQWLEEQAGSDNLKSILAKKGITDEATIGKWWLIEEEVKGRIRQVINSVEQFK